ncbi:MAG: FG-GAP-like repeat-containing protein [Chitinophagales bacterium]
MNNLRLDAQFNMSQYSLDKGKATGEGGYAIKSVDIDHDGKVDIVADFSGSANVQVFLNTSTGEGAKRITFSTPFLIEIEGNKPFKFDLSDLNRDQRPEVILVDDVAGELIVFKNISSPGSVKFASPQTFAFPDGIISVTSCDLNMDSFNELIANCGESLGVLKNTSAKESEITFDRYAKFPMNGHVKDIRCADIDGDGYADIAAGTSTGISVLRSTFTTGSKTISFNSPEGFSTGHSVNTLDIGDMDGDFKPDIVTANWPENNFSVIKNISEPGKINFSDAINVSSAASTGIALADFDQDGKLDVATMSDGKKINVTELYRNISEDNDQFTFAVAQNYIPAGSKIIIDDFDNNGNYDLAGVNDPGNTISFLFNGETAATNILKTFDVFCGEEGEVLLNWECAIGNNNSKFIVERTTDGRKFIQLTTIDGNGSGDTYMYSDKSASDEIAYYRIKITGPNGSVNYSDLKLLKPCDNALSDFVCVYPNPVDKIMNFHFSLKSNMEMHYEVLDNRMEKQIEKTELVTPGTRTYTLDISQFSQGTYFLVVNFGNLPSKVCRFEKK